MSIIFEILFEAFGEIFFKVGLDIFSSIFIKIARLFSPHKTLSAKVKDSIRNIVKIAYALMFISIIVGIMLLCFEHTVLNIMGRYLVFVPLFIIALIFISGIVLFFARLIKRRKN